MRTTTPKETGTTISIDGFWCTVTIPYREREHINKVPGVLWNKDRKVWKFPLSSIGHFLNNVPWVSLSNAQRASVKRWIVGKQKVEELRKAPHGIPKDSFLMWHQQLCRTVAQHTDRYCFYLDTGTGKTITALSIINDNLPMKWAVVCPLSIMATAWVADADDFFPHLRILPLNDYYLTVEKLYALAARWGISIRARQPKKVLLEILAPAAQVYLINPESLHKARTLVREMGYEGLIFDESVRIKNPQARVTKQVLEMSQEVSKLYLLSGKPAPNNEMEYFSQLQAVDPSIFGNSFYSFRNRYFYPTDYNRFNWKMIPEKYEQFLKGLDSISIAIAKEECLDLPDKTYEIREVLLTGKARSYYREMERERMLEVDDWTVVAANKLTNIMKLRQITSGFVIDDEDTHQLHNHKMQELVNVLEDIGDRPVIIWAQFRNEIRTIAEALQKKGKTVVTAFSETKDVNHSIDSFKNGEAQYIVAHPQTLKYGVTFTHCSYAVYYSLSYSYDDYYQSHDRIYRKGQTQPCTFIFLLCKDTIDETVYKAVQYKQDLGQLLQERVRMLRG